MSKETGGPAFPRIAPTGYVKDDPDELFWERQRNGMTLRDWFAGQALKGIISAKIHEEKGEDGVRLATELAFRFADAMLRQRERGIK